MFFESKPDGGGGGHLSVVGRSSTLLEDEEMAEYVNSEASLLQWSGDASLWMDRYDARHLLDSLKWGSRKRSRRSEVEGDNEAEIENERYLDLHSASGCQGDANANQDNIEIEASDNKSSRGVYSNVPFSYENFPSEKTKMEEPKSPEARFQPPFPVPENLTLHLPPTEKIHQIMAKTAKFILEKGGQAEIILRVKQANNPNFKFLNHDDVLQPYFRYLVNHPQLLESKKEEKTQSVKEPSPSTSFSSHLPPNPISLLSTMYGDDDDDDDDDEEEEEQNDDEKERKGKQVKDERDDKGGNICSEVTVVNEQIDTNDILPENTNKKSDLSTEINQSFQSVPNIQISESLFNLPINQSDSSNEPLPPGIDSPLPSENPSSNDSSTLSNPVARPLSHAMGYELHPDVHSAGEHASMYVPLESSVVATSQGSTLPVEIHSLQHPTNLMLSNQAPVPSFIHEARQPPDAPTTLINLNHFSTPTSMISLPSISTSPNIFPRVDSVDILQRASLAQTSILPPFSTPQTPFIDCNSSSGLIVQPNQVYAPVTSQTPIAFVSPLVSFPTPPEEVKKTIFKIVEYVVKNGRQFENIILQRDVVDCRFPFLRPGQLYHDYYLNCLNSALLEKDGLSNSNPSPNHDQSVFGGHNEPSLLTQPSASTVEFPSEVERNDQTMECQKNLETNVKAKESPVIVSMEREKDQACNESLPSKFVDTSSNGHQITESNSGVSPSISSKDNNSPADPEKKKAERLIKAKLFTSRLKRKETIDSNQDESQWKKHENINLPSQCTDQERKLELELLARKAEEAKRILEASSKSKGVITKTPTTSTPTVVDRRVRSRTDCNDAGNLNGESFRSLNENTKESMPQVPDDIRNRVRTMVMHIGSH